MREWLRDHGLLIAGCRTTPRDRGLESGAGVRAADSRVLSDHDQISRRTA